jgi:hypothetical protein
VKIKGTILDNPDSLCARLLRAKYYPNGRLVDTVFAGNASAVWRGIEYGLEHVKKGYNGELVMVVTSKHGEIHGYPRAQLSSQYQGKGSADLTKWQTYWMPMVLGGWIVYRNTLDWWILKQF